MLRHIIKREILDNLLSLRLSLTLMLMVIIMSMSAFLFISDHKESRSTYDVNLLENRKQMEEIFRTIEMPDVFWKVMSFTPQWVYKSPSNFTFLADGQDKNLPNAFIIWPFEVRGPETRLRANPLLQTFENLDWSLVIGVIMSFAAIVLTFDAVSGDRERGTLKLSMSNAVPRATALLGKYIGALVSLLISLLTGILLNVIIIAVSGIVPLDGSAWARIGMVTIISSVYVAGFVSLGIFVSSITRESATSLIVLLLSWAMLVIVIPGVGGIIASRAVNVPSVEQNIAEASRAWGQARDEYRARHRNAIVFRSSRWSPGENLAGPLAAYEAQNSVGEQYMDTMVRQVEVGQNTTRISPLGLYRHATEALAGTGIGHYESFMKQVRQYREFLRSVLLDKYPLDPHKHYGRGKEFMDAMSKVSFGLSDIPEFREDPISVEEGAKAAIWDIFFLSLFALLFFMGGVVTFLRYDVR